MEGIGGDKMAQFDPKMSVEAYLDLEKQSEQRHEYIDGYVNEGLSST